jgi:F0F1-type ATP synthase epsilon subunit
MEDKLEDKLFEFKLLTGKKEVFSSSARFVALPGENGEFGVLNNHLNLISTLTFGLVKIKKQIMNAIDLVDSIKNEDDFDEMYCISEGGIAHFFEDKLVVAVDYAMKVFGDDNDQSEEVVYKKTNLNKEEQDFYNLSQEYMNKINTSKTK